MRTQHFETPEINADLIILVSISTTKKKNKKFCCHQKTTSLLGSLPAHPIRMPFHVTTCPLSAVRFMLETRNKNKILKHKHLCDGLTELSLST